jgi:hypothetical protein
VDGALRPSAEDAVRHGAFFGSGLHA